MKRPLIVLIILLFLSANLVGCQNDKNALGTNNISTAPNSKNISKIKSKNNKINLSKKTSKSPIILYSIKKENLPVDRIPYYNNGGIFYFSTNVINDFNRDDTQSWRKDPIETVKNLTGNLIPDNVSKNLKNGNYTIASKLFKNKDGITITRDSSTDKNKVTVNIKVPGFGEYRIDLMKLQNIYYIEKILLYPNITKKSFHPIVVYNLSKDFLNRPLTQIPYYSNGFVVYQPDLFFKQFREGGHQPWLADPLTVVQALASNLIPEKYKEPYNNGVWREQTFINKYNVTIKPLGKLNLNNKNHIVEINIPTLGKYEIHLVTPENTLILFITKIILYAIE